jgi:hypothetical protein
MKTKEIWRREMKVSIFCKLKVSAVITLGLILSAASLEAAPPTFTKRPTLGPNSNLRAPMVGMLRFTVDQPVTTIVSINDRSRRWEMEFDSSWDPSKGIPLIGLEADVRHEVFVSARNSAGEITRFPNKLVFVPQPMVSATGDNPRIRVTKISPQRTEPGYTLFVLRRAVPIRPPYRSAGQFNFMRQWGALVIVDDHGRIVWRYEADSRIAGVDQFEDGNILFHRADNRTLEVDLFGNVVNQWYAARNPEITSSAGVGIEVETLHHQPHEMPNGNFLALTANARMVKGYYDDAFDLSKRRDRMVMGDDIVEIDRKTGKVLWRWSAWDHLDPFRIGYEATNAYWPTRGFPDHADWTHGNGVTYDPTDDSVLVSFRHQEAILKIDRKTGQVKWILGRPGGWGRLEGKVLRPVGEPFRWPSHQHNPHISTSGSIVVYDNGFLRARPPEPWTAPEKSFSRGVEYKVDEKTMTVRQLWASHDGPVADSCFSWAMSDARQLPKTGNILIIDAICADREMGLGVDEFAAQKYVSEVPSYGRIREYDHATKEVLFEVIVEDPNEQTAYELFGGLRIPSLYPPGRAPKIRSLP